MAKKSTPEAVRDNHLTPACNRKSADISIFLDFVIGYSLEMAIKQADFTSHFDGNGMRQLCGEARNNVLVTHDRVTAVNWEASRLGKNAVCLLI